MSAFNVDLVADTAQLSFHQLWSRIRRLLRSMPMNFFTTLSDSRLAYIDRQVSKRYAVQFGLFATPRVSSWIDATPTVQKQVQRSNSGIGRGYESLLNSRT